MFRKSILIVIFCLFHLLSAYAAELFLNNGDHVSGELLYQNEDSYVVKTEAMGVISVLQTHVKELIRTDPDPKAAEVKTEKKKIWSGSVDMGANVQKGNKETVELKSGLALKRKTKKNEFDVKGNVYYSEDDKKMNAQKYFAMTRYAFSFGEELKWYNFYKFEADHDRFANIDSRLTPTTGIGYWFYDLDDLKALFETGVGLQYTKFRDGQESASEGILVPRIYLEKRLLGKSRISEDFTVYSSFTEFGEYRLKSETILSAPITEQTALKLTVLDEYNSKPGGAAKKNDLRLTSSLAYSF